MKIILLQDVAGVGRKYDVRKVKDGYARNFLLAGKLAEMATPAAVKIIEAKKLREEEAKAAAKEAATESVKKLKGMKITIEAQANEKGHLFAAIKPPEIIQAIKEKRGVNLQEELLKIASPVKETGEHKIKIGETEIVLEVLAKK